MNYQLVFLGLCVSCLSNVGKINGENNGQVPDHLNTHSNAHAKNIHQKSQSDHTQLIHSNLDESHVQKGQEKSNHQHQQRLHQKSKELKFRDNGQDICKWMCCSEYLSRVMSWLNNTKELELLYSVLPPRFNGTTNYTTENPIINKNSTSEYPIISYLIKRFAAFLSSGNGLRDLFSRYPSFGVIWREVVGSFALYNTTDVLLGNFRELFGGSLINGTAIPNIPNIFNQTYWQQFLPCNTSSVVSNIEHGIGSLFNLTALGLREKKAHNIKTEKHHQDRHKHQKVD